MPDLLLLRHGESEWNRQHRFQGQADPPLSSLGEQQARLAVERVRDVAVVASSDLRRALRTAEIVAEAVGAGDVVVEPGLRERDTGKLTGLTRDEVERRWPDRYQVDPPGWEGQEAVLRRVLPALRRVAVHGERILVITHAGIIRALEDHLAQPSEPLPNMGGRWVHVEDDELRAGERVVLIDPDDERLTVPLET